MAQAMEFLRKATTKIVAAAGYGPEATDEYKQQLQTLARLEGQISSLKSTFIHYAKSIQSMSSAACSVASEVGKFYASSKARAKSVKLFTDAHFHLESVSDTIVKEQFSSDILWLLDEWSEEVKKAKKLISQTQQVATQVSVQAEKVKGLIIAKEKKVSKGLGSTPKEDQTIVDEEKQLEKYTKLLATMRATIEKTVAKLVEGRFGRFDACFVRIMEIQLEFFRQAAAQTEIFSSNIENYRKRYPRTTSKAEVVSPPVSSSGISLDSPEITTTFIEPPKSQDGTEQDWESLREAKKSISLKAEEEAKKRREQRRKEAEEEAQKAAVARESEKKGEESEQEPPMGDFLGLFGRESAGVPPTPPSSDRGVKEVRKPSKLTITTETGTIEHVAPLSAPARAGEPASMTATLFEEFEPMDTHSKPPPVFSPASPRSPLSPMMPSMDEIFPSAPSKDIETVDFDVFKTDGPVGGEIIDDIGRPPSIGVRVNSDTIPPTPPPSARGYRKGPGLDLTKLSAGLSGISATQTPVTIPPTPPPSARGGKPPLSTSLNLDALSAGLENLAEELSPSPTLSPVISPRAAPPSTSGLDFTDDGLDSLFVSATVRRSSGVLGDGLDAFDPFSDSHSTSEHKSAHTDPETHAPDPGFDLEKSAPKKEGIEGSSGPAPSALEEFRQNQLGQEKLAAEKRLAASSLHDKLNAWEFKDGARKNIRTLLGTLDQVLWENSGWKKASLADLTDFGGVKKAYRNALMIAHPDRVQQNGTPEQIVIAERVFEALNTSFEQFRSSQNER